MKITLTPDIDELFQLFPLVDFALQPMELEKWYTPKIRSKNRSYYGPKSLLENFTLRQFGMADTYFSAFFESLELDKLDTFIACLYTRKGKKFSIENFPDHLPDNFSNEEKTTIWANFLGLKNKLKAMYPNVFKKVEESDHKDGGWQQVILSLAETGTFGTSEETKEMFIHEVFVYMEMLEKRRIELETKTPSS